MAENVNSVDQELDALQAALISGVNMDEANTIVKSEDLPQDGGVDFSKHFFEPQPGKEYSIKFLPNLENMRDIITHRSVYKALPDPERKGKTFQFVSSANAKTCPVLELFFELNNLKKNGDVAATQKIEKFLSKTNQGACIVQILDSPDAAEIGNVRIMTFSTYGPNSTIANLINQKLNPSEKMIKDGFEREDITDIFEASILNLVCKESLLPDGRKGRDYAQSTWLPKKKGAIVKMPDGTVHVFSKADKDEAGKLKPEVKAPFLKFFEILKNPDYSMHNYFSYKKPGDPMNTEDTEKYIQNVFKKVEEIIPVIKEKSVIEITNYGKGAATTTPGAASDSAKTIDAAKAADILKESAPTELQTSVLNGAAETGVQTPAPTAAATDDDLVAAALTQAGN